MEETGFSWVREKRKEGEEKNLIFLENDRLF